MFGPGAEALAEDARRALGAHEAPAPDVLRESGLCLAWAGSERSPGTPVAVLAGRLWNHEELAADLDADPALGTSRLVEAGYARWRDRLPVRLRGAYTLAAWDSEARTGLLAVDHLGAGGLFLRELGGRLCFAAELRELARLLPQRLDPEPRAVVQWLVDGWLSLGETLLRGVRRLEGGHLIRLEGERWSVTRYWEPRYVSDGTPTRAEAGAEIGRALERSIRGRLPPSGTTGVLLSGGLDSSSVAAVARGLVPERADLRSYSLVYPNRPEMDESALIDLLAGTLDFDVVCAPVAEESVLAAGLRYQAAWGLPAPTPMFAFSEELMRRAREDSVVVMLDGEGGDELFGCSPYLVADRLLRADVRGALSLAGRVPEAADAPSLRDALVRLADLGLKGALPHGFHLALRRAFGARYAPDWLHAPAARLYVDSRDLWTWKELAGPRWWAFLADLLVSLRQRMGVHDFLRHREAFTGVAGAHPLLDDLGLVELVLSLPPELSFDRGLTRPLLREAMAGAVPDAVRLRREKPEFSQLLVDSVKGPDLALVTRILSAPDTEIRAYAKPERVAYLLGIDERFRHIAWARLLWRLVTVETWLRGLADPGFPAALLEASRSLKSDQPSAADPRDGVTS